MTNTQTDRFRTIEWRVESLVSAAHVFSRQVLGKALWDDTYNADDIDTLGALKTLDVLEYVLGEAFKGVVAKARKEGTTWEQIGDAFHITKQAAQQRFGSTLSEG